MKKKILSLAITILTVSFIGAQENTQEKLKIFVEGNTVDFNYMRNNTTFVDFVTDPNVCDVHLIIASQSTGGGGEHFTLEYYGGKFPGLEKMKLSCNTYSYDTHEQIREKLTKTMHTGLLPYINEKTGIINFNIPDQSSTNKNNSNKIGTIINDPWNKWVFTLGASGGFSGEEQKKYLDYELSFRAKKFTDTWKISNEYDYEKEEGRIEIDDNEYINTIRIEQDADVKLVFSMNPHWSFGIFFQGTQSSYKNIQMNIEATPALQYNIYNWKESDRRRFTFSYYTGPSFNRYYENTILNKKSEWLWAENIEINLNKLEKWGEIDLWLEGGHYYPSFKNYFYEAGIDLSFRISKGLSIYFEYQTESIHNQIYLPVSELSDEELLLNTRKLPTTFEYSGSIGIRFQFGSIYNNIVNERL